MNSQSTKTKKKYRLDIIIVAAILLVSIVLLLIITLSKEEGSFAVVEINGVVVAEYSLDKNGVYPLNGGTNVLVIENGVAYLNYSSCPDHTCERTGKIKYVGQAIICLPNELSITIKGNAEGGVDLVS
jgi:hypothetical protein